MAMAVAAAQPDNHAYKESILCDRYRRHTQHISWFQVGRSEAKHLWFQPSGICLVEYFLLHVQESHPECGIFQLYYRDEPQLRRCAEQLGRPEVRRPRMQRR